VEHRAVSFEATTDRLLHVHRRFGRRAASAKAALLGELAAAQRLPARTLARLADPVEFIRAHPDDAAVRRALVRLVRRLPGTEVVYEYSYGVVRRLLTVPDISLEIAWDELDESTLLGVLELLLEPAESDGLNDTRLSLGDWWHAARPAGVGDVEWLVGLFERSGLPDPARVHLFESCGIPLRLSAPSRSELSLPVRRVHYQRRAPSRARVPLRPFILGPADPSRRGGAAVVDLCLRALCARSLEIHGLIYASDADVVLIDGQGGLTIALLGVEPPWRSPLETLFTFLLFKNGVPIAYGPLGVFGGCCEMGMNLFPEFRGGEVRLWYAQLMRAVHHRLGVDTFLLTRYAMGEDNDEALESGAFWFYRKLGFRAVEADVERLAREEEARRRRRPGHRSDRRTLRRLSRTEAVLALEGARRRPIDFYGLSSAASRELAEDGREQVAAPCARRIGRLLGLDSRARAVRAAAPLLALIPELARWPLSDRTALARLLVAKDAPSERRAAVISARHPRLTEALARVAAR
jgi:hypothetical protein